MLKQQKMYFPLNFGRIKTLKIMFFSCEPHFFTPTPTKPIALSSPSGHHPNKKQYHHHIFTKINIFHSKDGEGREKKKNRKLILEEEERDWDGREERERELSWKKKKRGTRRWSGGTSSGRERSLILEEEDGGEGRGLGGNLFLLIAIICFKKIITKVTITFFYTCRSLICLFETSAAFALHTYGLLA